MPFSQEQDAALRRIAILLRALPEHTHTVLLERLGTLTRRRIGDQMHDLGDVDPMEQHRVLTQLRDQFAEDEDGFDQVESEIQDEISIGSSRFRKARPRFDAMRAFEVESAGDSSSDPSNGPDDGPLAFSGNCATSVATGLPVIPDNQFKQSVADKITPI